jgi:hypothetical protein
MGAEKQGIRLAGVASIFVMAVGISILNSIGYHELLGRAWSVPAIAIAFLVVAFLLLWRGFETGRWLAAISLLVVSLNALIIASFELISNPTRSAVMFMMFLAAAVASIILLFAESTGDYIGTRFRSQIAPVEWMSVFPPLVSAGRQTSSTDGPFRMEEIEEMATAALKRARFGRRVPLGLVAVALGTAVVLAYSLGLLVLDGLEASKDLEKQARTVTDEAMSSASGLAEKLNAVVLTTLFAAGTGIAQLMISVMSAFAVPVVYILFFIAPFVLSMPLSLPFALRWTRPAHFLLLRPFHRQELSGPLARLVRKTVSGFGHVYTLADAALRVPLYVRIPLVLGQIALFSFRLRTIREPNDIFRLCRAMRRRTMRNLNWLFSINKIFAVASTDAAWQAAVSRLACEVDLILIDVSGITDNIIWELQQCDKLGRRDRVVLFVRAEEREATVRLLTEYSDSPIPADRLLSYKGDKFLPDRHDGQTATYNASEIIAKVLLETRQDVREDLPGPSLFEDPIRRRQCRAALFVTALLVASSILIYTVARPPSPLPFARVIALPGVDQDSKLELAAGRQLVVTKTRGGVVRITDLDTQGQIVLDALQFRSKTFAVSASGSQIAYEDWDSKVAIRELPSGAVLSTSKPNQIVFPVESLSFSPDGAVLAWARFASRLEVWKPRESQPQLVFNRGPGDYLTFSGDGQSLVAADRGGNIEIWDVSAQPALRRRWYTMPRLGAIAWSDDGARIAAGGNTIQVWDAITGTLLFTPVSNLESSVQAIAFGADSDSLVWTTGFQTALYAKGERIRFFAHPDSTVYGPSRAWIGTIALSRDRRTLFGTSAEGAIVVWDVPSKTE